MSEFKTPWQNEWLGEYYTKNLLEIEPKVERRTRRHYAKKALFDLGLAQNKKYKNRNFYELSLKALAKHFLNLIKAKVTEENIAELEQRLAWLRISQVTTDEILKMSKNLFGNTSLENVVKTLGLCARDYTITQAGAEAGYDRLVKCLNNPRLFEIELKGLTQKKRVFLENKLESIRQKEMQKVKLEIEQAKR